MSVTVSGVLIVPADMAEVEIAEIQQALDCCDMPYKPVIIRDIDRDEWVFDEQGLRKERFPAKGLRTPTVFVHYTCDTGAGPDLWAPGIDDCCNLARRLGYHPVDPRTKTPMKPC